MTSNGVTNLRDENVDDTCRKNQIYPSSRNRGAPRLTCRWQKDKDDTLVMAWSFGEATPHAQYSLIGGTDPQPPKHVPNDGFVYRRQSTNRLKSMAEQIAIAVLLGFAVYMTVVGFFIEHND